jgi:hypothetical protein
MTTAISLKHEGDAIVMILEPCGFLDHLELVIVLRLPMGFLGNKYRKVYDLLACENFGK